MNKEKLTVLYKKYELTKDDIYKHKHYSTYKNIITNEYHNMYNIMRI